jgi:hypothetical protein
VPSETSTFGSLGTYQTARRKRATEPTKSFTSRTANEGKGHLKTETR